jgi:hypothetical protein
MIMGTGWREVRGDCINDELLQNMQQLISDDDVLINSREMLGSSEITAYLSGLCQPGPLGRLVGGQP